MDGQRALMFCRATWRFSELKALLALTSNASQCCSLKALFMACTAVKKAITLDIIREYGSTRYVGMTRDKNAGRIKRVH